MKGDNGTRLMFPQTTSDLRVRWCSPYVKIDVAAKAINNDPALKSAKILFVTGERRQESTARSKYAQCEPHRCDNQKRRVDAYRAVIDWDEAQVWAIVRRHGIDAHPAYHLGYGRLSCQTCIFADADQWATNRAISPERFARIAAYEVRFG